MLYCICIVFGCNIEKNKKYNGRRNDTPLSATTHDEREKHQASSHQKHITYNHKALLHQGYQGIKSIIDQNIINIISIDQYKTKHTQIYYHLYLYIYLYFYLHLSIWLYLVLQKKYF